VSQPIELFYWPTPNGQKASIMLEEVGLPYMVRPVNILKGEQFDPAFLAVNPNNKVPAIIDPDGPDGTPIAVFESGAVLVYLAEKTGKLLPAKGAARYRALQWLFFQVGGVGPMFGQLGHFKGYAPEPIPYAMDRYRNETLRLYGVMDEQLARSEYLAGDYSVADVAVYPWVDVRWFHEIDLSAFPNVARWFETVSRRDPVARGARLMKDEEVIGNVTEETREIYFGNRQRERR
jgi:GSH-dependent disulfide-bond oxidoreductase